MNSTQKRYAARLQELINEGKDIEALVKKPDAPKYPGAIVLPGIEDKASLNAWLIKAINIIEIIFGSTSTQFKKLEELTKNDNYIEKSRIGSIRGVLIGSLDDLNNGFLLDQEFLIAGEIFDSILEEAKELLNAGYKNPAAMLGRVVLEGALKRLSRQEQLDDTQKATKLNDDLKKAGRYNQVQWRHIQAYLDIGNSAAHGKFEEYTEELVRDQIEGIQRFIANDFKV